MTRKTMEKLERVAIGDLVVDLKPGFAVGERDSDGVVQVRMNNVGVDGSLDLLDVIRVPATAKQVSDCSLKEGDILFNNTNIITMQQIINNETLPCLHFTRHFLKYFGSGN